MHLDLEFAIPLAALAASALGVEREAGFGVAPLFGEGEFRKKIADEIEGTDEGGGVRARGAADRGLVGEDEFLDCFQAGDGIVRTGLFF